MISTPEPSPASPAETLAAMRAKALELRTQALVAREELLRYDATHGSVNAAAITTLISGLRYRNSLEREKLLHRDNSVWQEYASAEHAANVFARQHGLANKSFQEEGPHKWS